MHSYAPVVVDGKLSIKRQLTAICSRRPKKFQTLRKSLESLLDKATKLQKDKKETQIEGCMWRESNGGMNRKGKIKMGE